MEYEAGFYVITFKDTTTYSGVCIYLFTYYCNGSTWGRGKFLSAETSKGHRSHLHILRRYTLIGDILTYITQIRRSNKLQNQRGLYRHIRH